MRAPLVFSGHCGQIGLANLPSDQTLLKIGIGIGIGKFYYIAPTTDEIFNPATITIAPSEDSRRGDTWNGLH